MLSSTEPKIRFERQDNGMVEIKTDDFDVTLSVDDWSKIVASISRAGLSPGTFGRAKDIHMLIFDEPVEKKVIKKETIKKKKVKGIK